MTQERAAQSGAAASSAALAQAVRGITLLLCATLNDGDTPPGSAAAPEQAQGAPVSFQQRGSPQRPGGACSGTGS